MATRFEFVIQGQNPRSYTKETQTKIRRQAMRAAALARKQAGNYGKRNMRQCAVVVVPPPAAPDEASPGSTSGLSVGEGGAPPGLTHASSSSSSGGSRSPSNGTSPSNVGIDSPPLASGGMAAGMGLMMLLNGSSLGSPSNDLFYLDGTSAGSSSPQQQHGSKSRSSSFGQQQLQLQLAEYNRLPTPMPFGGFDTLVVEYGVHPQDLSALTFIHIGPIASGILGADTTKLPGLLACRQWSYFDFVASRFGEKSCLDDALRCIALKTKSVLVPDSYAFHTAALAQYGKALKSLQRAVNDPASWADADVLCATEILSLFELLSFHNMKGWNSHILGARRLIQLRGPHRFKTEFEKALFLSLVGPIVCDALLGGERCFLESDGWQQCLHSTIDPDSGPFSERSPISISLLMHLAKMPGNFRSVSDVVWLGDAADPDEIAALVRDLRQERKDMLEWRRDFDCLMLTGQSKAEEDKRYELLGTGLVVATITSRLLGAVCPSQRQMLEDETLNYAREIKNLEGCVFEWNQRAGLHLNQKARIAEATLTTAVLWEDPGGNDAKVISREKFESWCAAFPRVAFPIAKLVSKKRPQTVMVEEVLVEEISDESP